MARDIQFTDTSTPGAPGRTITAWEWKFGAEGAIGTSTDQHPLLEDAPDTSFPVTLTVTQDDNQQHSKTETIPAADPGVIPASITITTAETPLEEGKTRQLDWTESGTEPITVSWSSDDEQVATVDSEGLITAVAEGNCIITGTPSNAAGQGTPDTYALEVTAAEPGGDYEFADDFAYPGGEEPRVWSRPPTWDGGAGVGGWAQAGGGANVHITPAGRAAGIQGDDRQGAVSTENVGANSTIRALLYRASSYAGVPKIYFRASSNLNDSYSARWSNGGWEIRKYAGGNIDFVSGNPAKLDDAFPVGETRTLEIVLAPTGFTMRVYDDDDALIGERVTTDTTHTGAGRIAIAPDGAGANGFHFDWIAAESA